jgi:hypothetical protein
MPTGDYADEAAFREQMGASPYLGITGTTTPSRASAYAPLLDNIAAESGVDADYLARIMKIESGGDPNNRTGSYRGLFQLSPSEFAKYGGTGNIYDPEQNARAAANKTAAEAQNFQAKFGRLPTSTDLYMTHQQGEGGYANHIAAPDAPAWQNMYATAEGRQKGPDWAKRAIWGNIPDSLKPNFGSVNNVTSQDLIDIYARKLGYGADRLPLDTTEGGSPAGLPVDAGNLPEGLPMGLRNAVARSGGDTIPATAAYTAGQAPPPGPPPGPPTGNLPFGIPGTFLNNPVQQALGDNFSTLLAFAGGTRQGGIGQGLTQAAKASLIEQPTNEKRRQEQEAKLGIYQAVRAKGGSHADAIAMANSPEVFKAVAPELFGTPKIVKIGSNPITGDQYAMQQGGKLSPLPDLSGSGGGGTSNTNGMLKPGVKYDPTLSGEDYRNQFSDEVVAASKAYDRGDVMPTGNPRSQGIAQLAKTISQKLGTGNDALFSEKRKYRTELGSTSPSTAGGQAKAFTQGIEHADSLATKLEGLKNWNGLGVPFLAAGANQIREAFSTNQKGLANEARSIGQQLAGEVGKLFSGSQGGGVHERELTRNRFNTISSGPELAGALEGTIETMEGGLKALESRRDQILGPESDVKFLTAETEKKIAHIREIIARLKSGEAAAPAGAPAAAPAPVSGFKVLGVR